MLETTQPEQISNVCKAGTIRRAFAFISLDLLYSANWPSSARSEFQLFLFSVCSIATHIRLHLVFRMSQEELFPLSLPHSLTHFLSLFLPRYHQLPHTLSHTASFRKESAAAAA